MKYVVVDLEMNPLSKEYVEERKQCRSEVIQIGAVALDERYQEIGSFKTLVKPQYNSVIIPKIEKLTGITTSMVQEAPVFHQAIRQFFSCYGIIRHDAGKNQIENGPARVHDAARKAHDSNRPASLSGTGFQERIVTLADGFIPLSGTGSRERIVIILAYGPALQPEVGQEEHGAGQNRRAVGDDLRTCVPDGERGPVIRVDAHAACTYDDLRTGRRQKYP